jgi:hypothetical protein
LRISLWPAMAVLTALSGCNFAQQIAESSVSYYSSDHFTLVATVPANFGFTSKAHYYPKAGQSCEVYSPGLGANVKRQQQKSNATEAKNVEQTVSTDIPLEYHVAGCSMELARVSYEVSGRYGAGSLDRDYELAGGLSVRASTTDNLSQTTPSPIEQRGLCSWLFQISKSKVKPGEIEKLLSCSATDETWLLKKTKYGTRKPGGFIAINRLLNTTVKVEFRVSNEEQPSVGDTWRKFPAGWKPCLGKGPDDPYGFCRGNSKDFKTFKMNNRECTVYPNCVDQGTVNE